MLKYAREDTHYLLYIYEELRKKLIWGAVQSELEDPLGKVYRKSHEVCLRMYKKETFDKETSYAKQLAIVAGLFEWRDKVARDEDESIGYVLPNKDLLEIAKMKPMTAKDLLEQVGYNRPLVLRDADKIVEIIWAMQLHEPRFEGVAQEIKLGVPVSEIAAKHQERKNRLLEDEEGKQMMSNLYNQQNPTWMIFFEPRRWTPSPPMVWVNQPMFATSGFRVPRSCYFPIVTAQGHYLGHQVLHCQHQMMS